MKLIWVDTWTIEPPTHTVSARFGNSYIFAGYDKWLDRWWWLQPNGIQERIAEPEQIFVTEKWAREHPANRPRREKAKYIHKRREEQLLLI